MTITETSINRDLSWLSGGLRLASIVFPALAPFAAAASAVASVAPEVEAAAQKVETAITGNGGVVTADHLAAVNGLLAAQAAGLQVYADPPA